MYMRAEPAREHSARAQRGVVGRDAVQKIAVLDTSITSVNLGDQIIMDAARAVLGRLFPGAFFVTLPTHEFLLWESYRVLRDCDYVFVCGSNLLKSRMLWRNQWKISPLDFLMRRNCLLLGCGWWHYQRPPDFYSRRMLRRILGASHQHSVRDEYSRRQLRAAGIEGVLRLLRRRRARPRFPPVAAQALQRGALVAAAARGCRLLRLARSGGHPAHPAEPC